MNTRQIRPVVDIFCEGCGHKFQMGETVFLLHFWMIAKDYCDVCKNKIITFLAALEAQIPATCSGP